MRPSPSPRTPSRSHMMGPEQWVAHLNNLVMSRNVEIAAHRLKIAEYEKELQDAKDKELNE